MSLSPSADSQEITPEPIQQEEASEPAQKETPEPVQKPQQRKILGWIERVRIQPEDLLLEAKLTPGSEGNVLHAKETETFKREGRDWVRFEVSDRAGNVKMLERKVVDIDHFNTSKGDIKRTTVRSGICLDGVYLELEFGLSDRSNFDQEVRIGREALAGEFLIDPAKTKVTRPRCAKKIQE